METLMQVEPPWYRQFWPWMLIALPASAVIAGFVTLWFAIQTTDSLVVDDYYKEGKAINRTLARDERAASLGLAGRIESAPDGLRLSLQADTPIDWPQTLTLKFVHATRAPLDRLFTFQSLGAGLYVATDATLPTDSRWTLHLESPRGDWRLVQTVTASGSSIDLDARAVSAPAEGR